MHDGKRTLLLAHPELVERLLPVAQRWVATWMLDPFLIAAVPSGAASRPFDATMTGLLIGRDGVDEVKVLQFLALGNYELVRLVAVQLIQPAEPRIDRDALQWSADTLFRAAGSGTRFHRINLLVLPTAESCTEPHERLMPGWEANVVAAPENRHRVQGFDALVDSDDGQALIGHVLTNAATAGGFWVGMDSTPYDERTPVGGTGTLVSLQRTYARAVVMDDFQLRMARAGLQRLLDDDRSPFADAVLTTDTHGVNAELAESMGVLAITRELADAVVEHAQDGALRHDDGGGSPRRTVERRKVGPREAVTEFLRFSGDRILSVPSYFLWKTQQRTAERFDRILHGGDGESEVVLGKDPIGDLAAFVQDLEDANVEKEEILADIDDLRPHGERPTGSERELWETVRKVTFGMYDGRIVEDAAESSALPRIQDRLRAQGALKVLPAKSCLFPDWSDRFEPTPRLIDLLGRRVDDLPPSIGWLGVEEAKAWREAVNDARVEAERDLRGLLLRRQGIRGQIAAVAKEKAALVREVQALTDWLRSAAGTAPAAPMTRRLNAIVDRLPAAVREQYVRDSSAADTPQPADQVATAGTGELDAPSEALGAELEGPTALPVDEPVALVADASTAYTTSDAAADAGPVAEPLPASSGRSETVRISLWRRIVAWFRRRSSSAASAADIRVEPQTAVAVATGLISVCDATLGDLEDRLTALRDVEDAARVEWDVTTERNAALDAATRPFDTWYDRHTTSFAWQLIGRMDAERSRLAQGLEAEREWLAAPLPVTPEEALELYERFVRRFRRLVLWGLLLPATIQLALRTLWRDVTAAARARVEASEARAAEATASTPSTSGNGVAEPSAVPAPPATGAEAGVPGAGEQPAAPSAPATGTDAGGPGDAPGSAVPEPGAVPSDQLDGATSAGQEPATEAADLTDRIIAFLGDLPWRFILPTIAIILLLLLLNYYRAWSRRKRAIKQLRDDVARTRTWVHDQLGERLRLERLQDDATEVFQLISEFLHRPFNVSRSRPFARDGDILDALSSSMGLSVAEPLASDAWRGGKAFEQRIVAQQMRRGWLHDAFVNLTHHVESVTAQPEGAFAPELIDGSARTRRAFIEVISQSDDEPRARAGRERERDVIREMSDWRLDDELPFPDIRVIAPTRMISVDVRLDLLDDVGPDVHSMTDFLLQNVPPMDASTVIEPWGTWTVGVNAPIGDRETMSTFVQGAERYARRVTERGYSTFIPLRRNEARPVEMVVRVDCDFDRPLENLHGFERFRHTSEAPGPAIWVTPEPHRQEAPAVPTDV